MRTLRIDSAARTPFPANVFLRPCAASGKRRIPRSIVDLLITADNLLFGRDSEIFLTFPCFRLFATGRVCEHSVTGIVKFTGFYVLIARGNVNRDIVEDPCRFESVTINHGRCYGSRQIGRCLSVGRFRMSCIDVPSRPLFRKGWKFWLPWKTLTNGGPFFEHLPKLLFQGQSSNVSTL